MNNKLLAVIFSDWHVHSYQQFNQGTKRLDYCVRVLRDIATFCRKHDIKYILFGGDLYDKQKAIPTEVVNDVIALFKWFFSEYPEITFIAISGNHDYATTNTIDNPAITALKHLDTVFPRFVLIDNEYVEIEEGVFIHGVPYYEYPEDFAYMLEQRATEAAVLGKRNPRSLHYLLLHQTPAGLGNDMIAVDTNPTDPLYRIFNHSYCGHIHIHKDITEQFTLIGNPNHRDASDAGSITGFLVDNLLSPERPYRFIELTGYPKFIEVPASELHYYEEDDFNFIIPVYDEALGTKMEDTDSVSITSSTDPIEMLTNYCREVEPENNYLLTVGLSFIEAAELKPSEDE